MFTFQVHMGTVSDNHSAAVQRTPAEEQDDLCYASVRYSKQQEDPLYSNIRPVQPNRNKNEEQEEEDEGSVEYSVVKMKSGSASPEWVHTKFSLLHKVWNVYSHSFNVVESVCYLKPVLH